MCCALLFCGLGYKRAASLSVTKRGACLRSTANTDKASRIEMKATASALCGLFLGLGFFGVGVPPPTHTHLHPHSPPQRPHLMYWRMRSAFMPSSSHDSASVQNSSSSCTASSTIWRCVCVCACVCVL